MKAKKISESQEFKRGQSVRKTLDVGGVVLLKEKDKRHEKMKEGIVKIVKENINFERGLDPKDSMDVGIFSKINKITSSDLELLKIYTNSEGKGRIDSIFFKEVYGNSSGYKEYLSRVKEVYKLLEPFNYLFGDYFPEEDQDHLRKELKLYVKSYLKNPNYNYAYNCNIMGDVDVFFSEIKLPSAEEIK